MQPDESQLIAQAQHSSEQALTALIERWYRPVYAYFYKNTGRAPQAMDLTQEVFLKMAVSIGRYKPRASFQNWLFVIASNCLKNHYRTLSRRPECAALSEEPSAADASLIGAEQSSDLISALNALPPAQREAVLLRYAHDFSPKEIARITGVPLTTVKARIRYGLKKLRQKLEGYDEA